MYLKETNLLNKLINFDQVKEGEGRLLNKIQEYN